MISSSGQLVESHRWPLANRGRCLGRRAPASRILPTCFGSTRKAGRVVDFELTAAQRKRYDELASGVHDALAVVPPDHAFTRDRWLAAARCGVTGLCVPAEYGGSDPGALDTAVWLAAFGYGCHDLGGVF